VGDFSGEIADFSAKIQKEKGGTPRFILCKKLTISTLMAKPQDDLFLKIAAWAGAAAVGIGAFGAHGLKPKLSPYQLDIFEKGVQYHFVHALALLAVGLLLRWSPGNKGLARAGWLLLAGILCFSGSLYLLACRDLLPLNVAWAGPITPIGGVCFILGWALLALSGSKPTPRQP
jgi:uncharacterized membrane protein YgdD (TMEM256/DUF423 family)